MLDPPGTMRTAVCGVNRFTGKVDLSKKGWRAASTDISTTPPMRKPSRMPFLTQAFTRQPLGADRVRLARRGYGLRSARP